ncbi:MAG TPA: D-sedoheptulose 7-phosphate isomerase [bacterium]|nr:D-sedoheptulose 7-phosphate isomerase [bacterium]
MNDKIRTRIEESIQAKQKLLAQCLPEIEKAGKALVDAYLKGHKAVFFGNGGSAADAQHMAAELVGDYRKRRKAVLALALHTNTSTLTALGNDYGYDQVYSHQVEGLCVPGDVAVGISTSGNSENVLKGILAAKQKGVTTVALLGKDGGKIAREADISIIVPAKDTDRIQESHMLVGHIFCELVESALFP